MSDRRRLRSCRRRLPARLFAEHPDHATQLLERLARGRAQQLGGLPHLLRRQIGPDLQAPGVQRHQRDPVGEHVVHLARDQGALGHPRTVGVQALLGLGAQGTLAQREEELTSGPDEHSPRGGRERRARWPPGPPTARRSSGCRREGQGGRDPQRSDEQHRPKAAVHGEGEQREQPGGGGGHRERPQQDTDQRDAERPAPPPPQREAGQRPAADVDDHLPGRQRVDGVVSAPRPGRAPRAPRRAGTRRRRRPSRVPSADRRRPAGPDRPVPAARRAPAGSIQDLRRSVHDPSVEGARADPTPTKVDGDRDERRYRPGSGDRPSTRRSWPAGRCAVPASRGQAGRHDHNNRSHQELRQRAGRP